MVKAKKTPVACPVCRGAHVVGSHKKRAPAKKRAVKRATAKYYAVFFERGGAHVKRGAKSRAKSYEGPFRTRAAASKSIMKDSARYGTPRSYYRIQKRKPF